MDRTLAGLALARNIALWPRRLRQNASRAYLAKENPGPVLKP